MDVLYRLGSATANEVIAGLGGERHSSTVRTQLRLLEEKGRVKRERDGARYVYSPAVSKTLARKSALRSLVDTFFEGSTENAVSTLLTSNDRALSDEELDRLAKLIQDARRKRR